MALRLDTTARRVDVAGRKLLLTRPDGQDEVISYDKLVIGTGAVPVRPPIVVDPQLGALVHAELAARGVEVLTAPLPGRSAELRQPTWPGCG
jgi:NADPH-dependent 2,4-dienoyl-CoA reductase/sulfur reductase-like enzyme